jgi:competence protein ComGC
VQQCPNCEKEISRAAATKCPHCGTRLGHTPPFLQDREKAEKSDAKSSSYSCLVSCLIIIAIIGIILAILLPALARRRPHCCSCGRNLRHIKLALNMYANENNDRFPPIDDRKNNFTFDANLVYPDYLTDTSILECPHDRDHNIDYAFRFHPEKSSPDGVPPDCVTDTSYCYLGWLVTSDEEAEIFFEEYDKLSPEDYVNDIEVHEVEGKEPLAFKRLTSGIDRFLITDINTIFTGEEVGSSIIPVMWDRPYTDPKKLTHKNWSTGEVGGYVLYLDGHTEFVKFGEFPMTETMARLLEEHPREPIPDCEE